jgi:phenylalanyl-tRNA synthetase beta chain
MLISYNWLQTYFKKPLPKPRELAEALMVRAFEVEGSEEKGDDTIFDIKVLPDRARYALCHRGIASEVSAILAIPMDGEASLPVKSVEVDSATPALQISVDDPVACPRYSGRIVTNVSVGASDPTLVAYLSVLGQRSINNIVDSANFVMFDRGQPLHAFDADKVKGGIQVRFAKEGERITTLDGKEVALTPAVLVIADDEGPLAIAGIKGGKRAEVDAHTTRLILESASFEPGLIRRTQGKIGIRTDAGKRFENGYTPEYARDALEAFSQLIVKACPSAHCGPISDAYPSPAPVQTVSISLSHICALTGITLTGEHVEDIFRRLSLPCETIEKPETRFIITVPAERGDITMPEDVADEIVRLYCLENVTPVLPSPRATDSSDSLYVGSEMIRDALIGAGFSEIITRTLVAKGDFEVANALSDKSFLKSNLSDDMAHALAKNVVNVDLLNLDEIRMFEIGSVYPAEGEHLSLCLGGVLARKKKGRTHADVVHEGLSALSRILGPVSVAPTVLPNNAGAVVEINLSALVSSFSSTSEIASVSAPDVRFKTFSSYPYIVRDIAVFVPGTVKAEEVWQVIEPLIGTLAVTHRLFDVFSKKQPDGTEKTSYAFRIVFQSMERTLADPDVQPIVEQITKALNSREGWSVR